MFSAFVMMLHYFEEAKHAENEHRNNNNWKNVDEIGPHPGGYFYALSAVGFVFKIVKAPAAALCSAEQNNYNRAQRQKQIAYDEIFDIQNSSAFTEEIEINILKAKYARQRKHHHGKAADEAGFLFAPVKFFLAAGDYSLKYADDRCKRSKKQEDEEEAAHYFSEWLRHVIKYFWQGDEYQCRAVVHLYIKGEAGREDDETGGDGNEGVQNRDVY